jgi:2-C-methyl-D-erythritol 2,4-cyclodiphosphate synthase
MRVGQGFDVHALVVGRKLIIGGVEIPFERGLEGHSDADVLLHAVTDALLGAAALGDIGRHFPDTSAAYRGADSRARCCARRWRRSRRPATSSRTSTPRSSPRNQDGPAHPRDGRESRGAIGTEARQVNVKR